MSSTLNKIKQYSLGAAEVFDAWRIIPRSLLFCYGLLVYSLFNWYIGIETHLQTECDSSTLTVLLDKGVGIEEAKGIACTVKDTVGGPTNAQATFVTVIIGLSTAIIGLYLSSGRRWDNSSGGGVGNQQWTFSATPNGVVTPPRKNDNP